MSRFICSTRFLLKQAFILIVLILWACQGKNDMQNNKLSARYQNNPELIRIYKSDQTDRSAEVVDWDKVAKNDKLRRERVNELLDAGLVHTSQDFHHAALIFQHGTNFLSYHKAIQLMKKAIEIDSTADKWLLAAATDRFRLSTFRSQIYGTNYKKNKEGVWELPKYDPTKISDAERIAYHVETLAQQRETLRQFNSRKLTDLLSLGKDVAEIISIIKREHPLKTKAMYDVTASEIALLAKQLAKQQRTEEALSIHQLNISLYPKEFGAYYEYGKYLKVTGNNEEAKKLIQKSLDLNPDNDGAKLLLSEIK